MEDFLITPEEAVELFWRADGEVIMMGVQILKAYQASDRDQRDANLFSYGACFNAGIVEGVRRERAKRRRADHE